MQTDWLSFYESAYYVHKVNICACDLPIKTCHTINNLTNLIPQTFRL